MGGYIVIVAVTQSYPGWSVLGTFTEEMTALLIANESVTSGKNAGSIVIDLAAMEIANSFGIARQETT